MTHSWVGIVLAIVGLGIMILLHEWGHFVAAKLCGVRVEVFSIGFPPKIFGIKRGDTDYRISAIPFGGYVRMAGDNPAEERTGAPYEFLSRPRWQRLIIALAGPFMNLVLAFALLWGLYGVGMPVPAYQLQPAVVAGVLPNSPAQKAGLHVGDRIVSIAAHPVKDWEDAMRSNGIVPGQTMAVVVSRDGHDIPLNVEVPEDVSNGFALLGCPRETVGIASLRKGDPAERAGLKRGDEFVSADGVPTTNRDLLAAIIQDSKGQPIHFVIKRDGKTFPLTFRAAFTNPGDGVKRWAIGITFAQGQTVHESYPLGEAAVQSWREGVGMTGSIASFVVGLVSGKIPMRDMAGPIGIVQMSTHAAELGVAQFLEFMAFISVDLGLLNLLPIPILDGGHILMLAIEGSLRRDLSLAFKERFVTVGLVFLLAVFGFVMYFDVARLVHP